MASNILLLASKKCFLTSQGLVGAGMNCRALYRSCFRHDIATNYPMDIKTKTTNSRDLYDTVALPYFICQCFVFFSPIVLGDYEEI